MTNALPPRRSHCVWYENENETGSVVRFEIGTDDKNELWLKVTLNLPIEKPIDVWAQGSNGLGSPLKAHIVTLTFTGKEQMAIAAAAFGLLNSQLLNSQLKTLVHDDE